MNLDYILPSFLGFCLIAVCAWNVFQTGKIRDLESDVDFWKDAHTSIRVYTELLLTNLATAASKIPVRDPKGKFRKKV